MENIMEKDNYTFSVIISMIKMANIKNILQINY